MPTKKCVKCKKSYRAINGLYCEKLHRYVQHADTAPCGPQQNDNDMNNNELAIIRPENIQTIVQAAPQSYNDNKNSHDRCIDFGLTILNAVRTQGMNDELDQQAAAFIDKARRTVKVMNERRSPVTKLFDEVRSAFTTMENEIDPSKPGTVAYDLQQFRNQYAAKKRAEEERRLREEMARRQAEEARRKFRVDVEDDLKRQFQELVDTTINTLNAIDRDVTLENYAQSIEAVNVIPRELPGLWMANLKSRVRVPYGMKPEEDAAIVQDAKSNLTRQFSEQYAFEVGETATGILDRLPSKKANLERIAQANAEEAARMKAEMEVRQRAEAERAEKEMLACCAFSDWNPEHFLDVGNAVCEVFQVTSADFTFVLQVLRKPESYSLQFVSGTFAYAFAGISLFCPQVYLELRRRQVAFFRDAGLFVV